jgi:hypothetical protein
MAHYRNKTFFLLYNTKPEEIDNYELRRYRDIDKVNEALYDLVKNNNQYTKGSIRVIIGTELALAGRY